MLLRLFLFSGWLSWTEYVLHLSRDGFCRGGANRIIREIAWVVLNSGVESVRAGQLKRIGQTVL